jgi:hypothetical protein
MRTKTLDDNTQASHPGGIRLSHEKLRSFHPELYSLSGWLRYVSNSPYQLPSLKREYWKTHIEEHLLYGDSRAALVISVSPLLVAAYTDELDCIALLRFNSNLVEEYGLREGARLLTVNTYSPLTDYYKEDLEPGPYATGRYGNFAPYIAEFLTDDHDRVERRKAEISDDEWQRAEGLGKEYMAKHGRKARDGRPMLCLVPAERYSI